MRKRPSPTRPFGPDDPDAWRLAVAAGPPGVYVQNALAAGEGSGLLLLDDDQPTGLCWFGERGNLVVLADGHDPHQVTAAVLAAATPFRLALGPAAVVDSLAKASARRNLVLRDQLYCHGTAATAARLPLVAAVRVAERGDRDRLAQATLDLNASDLNVDPRRVDRRWLRDSIDERLGAGTTRVLGPVGAIAGKLDLGSDGPGGIVVEGVYTFPEARGRGIASALVAAVLAAAPGDVCLHVAAQNRPAQSAYLRAGLQVSGRCRLLLLA
jgi:GNAT superfamily N-acetyltransferase